MLTPKAKQPWDTDEVRERLLQNLSRAFHTTEKEAEKFAKMLRKSGGVIAGSCVLEAILNVHWEGSDVDIWMPHSGKSPNHPGRVALGGMVKWFKDHGYTSIRPDNVESPVYQRLHAYVQTIYHLGAANNSIDRYLGGWWTPKSKRRHMHTLPDTPKTLKNVQILTAREDKTVVDVVRSFDLVALQFYFDGKSIKAAHPDAYDSLHGEGGGRISKVALHEQGPAEWARTFVRLVKYSKRGIKLSHEGEQEIEKSINTALLGMDMRLRRKTMRTMKAKIRSAVMTFDLQDQQRPATLTLLKAMASGVSMFR